MRKQKSRSSAKRNYSTKRGSQKARRNKATWADPTVPITKASKRKKIKKLNLIEMRNNTCWWFG